MSTALKLKTEVGQPGVSFRVALGGLRNKRITCYLFRDPKSNKIWIMQQPGVLKDTNSAADLAELERLNNMTPISDNDTVEVDGEKYRVRIQGDYSDAGYLIKM